VRILNRMKNVVKLINSMDDRLQRIQQSLGRLENRQITAQRPSLFNEYEFQTYSQWGEDGLIQYLVNKVAIERPVFVEFGVATYEESNTRFLLTNNNWSGLIIDGSEQNIQHIKMDSIYWQYNLKAECAFIDKENINSLIQDNGISGDIGLLSVDIDGNDYWIWEKINVVNPRIVICEYNSLWGATLAVSTPYDGAFFRTDAHFSNLYYGASIAAFTQLAKTKGYSLIGSNKAGNNIFFVRNDLLGDLEIATPEDAWVQSHFRESMDEFGEFSFLPFSERLNLLAEMPLVNLADGNKYSVEELYVNK